MPRAYTPPHEPPQIHSQQQPRPQQMSHIVERAGKLPIEHNPSRSAIDRALMPQWAFQNSLTPIQPYPNACSPDTCISSFVSSTSSLNNVFPVDGSVLDAADGTMSAQPIDSAYRTTASGAISAHSRASRPPQMPLPSRVTKQRTKSKRKKANSSVYRFNVLTSDTPHTKVLGNDQAYIHVFGKGQNIRGSLTEENRYATYLTRNRGACVACHRKKQRCLLPEESGQPCERCVRQSILCVQHGARISIPKQPSVEQQCFSGKFHRLGSTVHRPILEWLRNVDVVMRYPQTILIDQDLERYLEIEVMEFRPKMERDKISYKWVDSMGMKQEAHMPPYYISDMTKLCGSMHQFVKENCETYVTKILVGANPIIAMTFKAARQYASITGSSLVSNVLEVWAAIRLTERIWRISGINTLGAGSFSEPGNPWRGILPVTPIMDTQLDELAIMLLRKMNEKVLAELDQKMKRRENSLEVFFTVFILMNSMELVFADMVEYTQRHGIQSRHSGESSLSDGYMQACNSLLRRYRVVSDSAGPLTSIQDEGIDKAGFDQREFFQSLQNEVSRQSKWLNNLKELSMYTTSMFWCYQVLQPDFKPDQPLKGPFLDFTEEDFLTS